MNQTRKKVSSDDESSADASPLAKTLNTELAIAQAKEAFDHVAAKSREAMEQGLKSVDTMTAMTRGNADALIESSRIATGGLQAIAQDVADFSKQSLERTASAAQTLASAKTMPELAQLQSEFAQTQFKIAVDEFNKLSQTMFQTMTEIFEPLQRRASVVAQIQDLMKLD